MYKVAPATFIFFTNNEKKGAYFMEITYICKFKIRHLLMDCIYRND